MTFTFFFLVSVTFMVLVSCCGEKEYTAGDGQCCPMCHEGTVVAKDCTASSGTSCSRCETGTYMNRPNGLKKCFHCTSCDSNQGLYTQKECLQTADTVCDVLSGFFCKSGSDSAGCSLAERHSVCKPGQRIKQPGTSRDDTVCEDCQEGLFSPDGVNCTLWTTCSRNQTKIQEGSSTSDVVCRNGAARHHYILFPPFTCLIAAVIYIIVKDCYKKKRVHQGPESLEQKKRGEKSGWNLMTETEGDVLQVCSTS